VTFRGVFAVDAIEGKAPHVVTEGGRRYQLVFPPGWRLESTGLKDADRQVVAKLGDTVVVRATPAAMASTQQIGPMLQVLDIRVAA
jgi:hypothetical protein